MGVVLYCLDRRNIRGKLRDSGGLKERLPLNRAEKHLK